VIGQGHTLVVVPGPTEFLMGSPAAERARREDESLHRQRVRRSFSIASKETTVEQFQRFLHENPTLQDAYPKDGSIAATCPQTRVTWYDAAAYCNWLNLKEGISQDQWCFLPNAEGKYAEGMKVAPDYLNLRGYRLPSEPEWEYACRAGAITAYSFGAAASSLAEYAILGDDSDAQQVSVGRRKPNDLGLFDMHGNVAEWCLDRYQVYPQGDGLQATASGLPDEAVSDEVSRVMRGGSCRDDASRLRCAARAQDCPNSHNSHAGFRIARSYP
jgi:formylglycine-generating enzyme required for sulfatase activity